MDLYVFCINTCNTFRLLSDGYRCVSCIYSRVCKKRQLLSKTDVYIYDRLPILLLVQPHLVTDKTCTSCVLMRVV